MRLHLCLSVILATAESFFFQRPLRNAIVSSIPSKRYDEQVVLRITIDSAEESREVLRAAASLQIDVWLRTNDHIDLRVDRSTSQKLFALIPPEMRESTSQLIPDLNRAILRSTPQDFTRNFLNERIPSINDTFFADYQTPEAIDAWMTLVAALHPGISTVLSLGKTHEGRDIKGLKIGRPLTFLERIGVSKRHMILVHGAQHAREWISISTVCYLAYSLIAGQATDNAMKDMVDNFDWLFIPTLNVDGYAYTFQDRLWRKNRQSTTVPICKGIDLDRNWDYGWASGQEGPKIMSNPCSENYQGLEAFEALETKALSDYIRNIHKSTSHKMVGYLDLHSYAQTILYPYALSCELDVRDEESLLELGVGASRAIKAATGEHYDTESACNQDGHIFANLNSGAALDWVYHSGVPWSFVVKLRDTGSYGFLVPKEEIVPTGEEMLGFLKYYSSFITEHTH